MEHEDEEAAPGTEDLGFDVLGILYAFDFVEIPNFDPIGTLWFVDVAQLPGGGHIGVVSIAACFVKSVGGGHAGGFGTLGTLEGLF